MASERKQRFVFDGRERLISAAAKDIRDEVEREYSGRLGVANWFTRMLLHWQMRREIRRRAERIAPRDALYMSA